MGIERTLFKIPTFPLQIEKVIYIPTTIQVKIGQEYRKSSISSLRKRK
jgi:hypothetical protein